MTEDEIREALGDDIAGLDTLQALAPTLAEKYLKVKAAADELEKTANLAADVISDFLSGNPESPQGYALDIMNRLDRNLTAYREATK